MARILSPSMFAVSIGALLFYAPVLALPTSYANAFVSPKWILDKSGWNANSTLAQQAIVSSIPDYAQQGPWSVV